jgi:hypothetical protein
MAASVEELAYEQALRAADHQEATLDGLRSRAGTLLAVASLATWFFGVKAIDEASDTWSTAIAIVLFLVVLGSVLYVAATAALGLARVPGGAAAQTGVEAD